MPILAAEPDHFPPELFASESSIDDLTLGNWWLVYTRSRKEKEMMRRLHAAQVAFYGPMIHRRSRSPSGRVRESHVPLFPGYVFLFGDEDARRTALQTNCVSTISAVQDGVQLVSELASLVHLLASDRVVLPEQRLEPGVKVRVTSGPLRGQEGTVIERRGKRRLMVAINLLQQGASVELDECDVQPL